MSFDRLIASIRAKQSPIALGLDPQLKYIPEHITAAAFGRAGAGPEGAAAAFLDFNRGLIDALCDIVPAVKPQAAFYEAWGWQGMRALHDTICYAREKGMFVITDAKRGDIGTTMAAYADAHLGVSTLQGAEFAAFPGDALTVNGYLGSDGIAPAVSLCQRYDKGIFVLVKTSNPSSGELQDRLLDDGREVYRAMGDLCEQWGAGSRGESGYSCVGAVVGATYPRQLTQLRQLMPHTFFLVPGYGAQGGGGADVAGAFDAAGAGAVVNSSRGLMAAWQKEGCPGEDFAGAARREALRMRRDIAEHL